MPLLAMSHSGSDHWVSLGTWADALASTIASQHDHQYVAVILRDEAGVLRLAGQRSGAGVDRGVGASGDTMFPVDGSISGRVFRTGTPALISDVRMDPDYLPFLGVTMRSELAVPIRIGDEIVGVVNLESPLTSAFEIVDLDDVVAQIGQAIGSFPAGAGSIETA